MRLNIDRRGPSLWNLFANTVNINLNSDTRHRYQRYCYGSGIRISNVVDLARMRNGVLQDSKRNDQSKTTNEEIKNRCTQNVEVHVAH